MLPKKSTFVRKSVIIWQKYRVIQNVRHSEKGRGRLTKKVTKNYVGGGFAAKKCDATHSKKNKRDFASDVLFDANLFCCIFYDCICWWWN